MHFRIILFCKSCLYLLHTIYLYIYKEIVKYVDFTLLICNKYSASNEKRKFFRCQISGSTGFPQSKRQGELDARVLSGDKNECFLTFIKFCWFSKILSNILNSVPSLICLRRHFPSLFTWDLFSGHSPRGIFFQIEKQGRI